MVLRFSYVVFLFQKRKGDWPKGKKRNPPRDLAVPCSYDRVHDIPEGAEKSAEGHTPDLPFTEITKMLAAQWAQLSQDKKGEMNSITSTAGPAGNSSAPCTTRRNLLQRQHLQRLSGNQPGPGGSAANAGLGSTCTRGHQRAAWARPLSHKCWPWIHLRQRSPMGSLGQAAQPQTLALDPPAPEVTNGQPGPGGSAANAGLGSTCARGHQRHDIGRFGKQLRNAMGCWAVEGLANVRCVHMSILTGKV
nr:uncharacterized protein LOC112133077 [Pongo abelii]